MRSKYIIKNALLSILEQFVIIISGFILPRLLLKYYGSQYNGLITSITDFLSCAVLLRSGIGGATRAALYKPIADNNHKEISRIIKATDNFMKKIGLILLLLILFFSLIYPLIVKNDFNYFFTFSLFLIIGASTFAESFFGITYLILLQADQKLWISSLFKIVSYIVNIIISIVLIVNNFDIRIVKFASSLIFTLYPIMMGFYVKRRYKIDKNVIPNNEAIKQRWDAFWHQVSSFVMNNTDTFVLTLFTNMFEVSVYCIYNLVLKALKQVIVTIENSLESSFGDMLAKKENIKNNFEIMNLLNFNLSTILYGCTSVLIFKFVSIYTNNVSDVNYYRPIFAYIMLLSNYIYCLRLPYLTIVSAAGHYKETKKGAFLEAFINLLLSVIFVVRYGIIGVAIGTLISTTIRTVELVLYSNHIIIKSSNKEFIKNLLISLSEIIIIIFLNYIVPLGECNNYFSFIFQGVIYFCLLLIIIIINDLLIYKKHILTFMNKIKIVFKKSNKCNVSNI